MTEPNAAQQELIDHEGGICCVDAGPGTGKTFAITRRYARLVDETAAEPSDVLLATFTESAATEMRDRIVARSSYGVGDLADAPIGTFHAHCLEILAEYGHDVPACLGVDERLSGSPSVLEDGIVEAERFREFFAGFREDNPGYASFFGLLDDGTDLLDLLNRLAARGIAPTDEGWYRNGAGALAGDRDGFAQHIAAVDEPRNDGSKQSRLRERLSNYDEKCYTPDAPGKSELRGPRGQKTIEESLVWSAFEADRSELTAFVHDVYHDYLAFALGRGYLTFGFLQLLAFVLLCEDDDLREDLAYDHVMIDEFQDTSEIQFKLALLLAGSSDVCVVGDWKQSIYAFQYAEVENIRSFEDRLTRFVAELNDDRERVGFDPTPVRTIELVENYRSTASIVEFSEATLIARATRSESIDADAIGESIVSLRANADHDESHVEAIQHAAEHRALLSKIDDVVGNDAYAIVDDDGDRRPPTYGDVTVLTRTRAFGRELLSVADEEGVPVAYDGDVAVFRTDPAKLLLAWLRILADDGERGWVVVLERAGYAPAEIERVLETESYPESMVAFREELSSVSTVAGVARRVFDRYGLAGPETDAVCTALEDVHDDTTLSRDELVGYVERAIETGATHDVDASTGTDAVTVQTIHGAKGREYPVVILANMNRHAFPPSGGGEPVITYDATLGLRQRKRVAEAHGRPHVYDDWRHAVLRQCRDRGYDEERRLLYVATTRAEDHLIFAAGETPNGFLESLPVDVEAHEPAIEGTSDRHTEQTHLPIAVPRPGGPQALTPHALMEEVGNEAVGEEAVGDEAVGEETVGEETVGDEARGGDRAEGGEGRGRSFGDRIHRFAERYATGEAVTPSDDRGDERRVAAFLDSLEGTLHVEQPAVLPLTVHGQRVVVSGTVDLVAVSEETVTVVDFKTDVDRTRESGYRTQLSCYHHVVCEQFPARTVRSCLFYTAAGERVDVEPLSLETIEEIVVDSLGEQ